MVSGSSALDPMWRIWVRFRFVLMDLRFSDNGCLIGKIINRHNPHCDFRSVCIEVAFVVVRGYILKLSLCLGEDGD